jgi:hypothetical protein
MGLLAVLLPSAVLAQDAGLVTLSLNPCSEPACGDDAFNRRYESVNPFISYSREPRPPAPKVRPQVSPPGSTLRVRVGETAFVTFACKATRIAFGNHPWDITPLGGGLASLRGFEPGPGSVTVWCPDGKRISYRIEISPAE